MKPRLRHRHAERDHIERADQVTWALLVFALVRGCLWLVMMGCVILGVVGVGWLRWAATLAALATFITLISLYANAEGEFSQAAGYWAAIRAGRAHAQGLHHEQVDEGGYVAALQEIQATNKRLEELAELIHDHQLRGER